MLIKKTGMMLLIVFILLSFLVIGCGGSEDLLPLQEEEGSEQPGEAVEEQEAGQEQLFTMEEIADFDGQEGRPAYIVVDGIVYDVTNVSQWSSGTHFGFNAGTDVSEALADVAPHGANLLNQAEIVGRIAE
jgi:predicted heme/steroid binding protein